MKLGASATSPGVTARWRGHYLCIPWAAARRLGRGNVVGDIDRFRGAWLGLAAYDLTWLREVDGKFTHRYQAKRAVEAAVSQALREAES